MIVEVLISCMHRNTVESVMELVERTNVKGPCVVVSQCDREEVIQKGKTKIVFTKERGLSRSRNMAIKYASHDICLICDDDEILTPNYEEIIIDAYTKYEKDIICFYISRAARQLPPRNFSLNYKSFWRVASVEISFKREAVINKGIYFDNRIGSGVSNCGGEENKFLLNCIQHRLKCFYSTSTIGKLIPDSPSQWFKGYNKTYFKDRAKTDRIILGPLIGRLLSLYFLIGHTKLIKKTNPETNILKMAWILLK